MSFIRSSYESSLGRNIGYSSLVFMLRHIKPVYMTHSASIPADLDKERQRSPQPLLLGQPLLLLFHPIQ